MKEKYLVQVFQGDSLIFEGEIEAPSEEGAALKGALMSGAPEGAEVWVSPLNEGEKWEVWEVREGSPPAPPCPWPGYCSPARGGKYVIFLREE